MRTLDRSSQSFFPTAEHTLLFCVRILVAQTSLRDKRTPMRATLSAKGQVVIPQPIRNTHKLKTGVDFTVLTRSNGDILLRRIKARRHHATFAENLLALGGLSLKPERGSARDVELCT